MEQTKISDFFPSRKFLIEVDFDGNNETAVKLFESAALGKELMHGLTVTKIYPKVAEIEDIDANLTRDRIKAAMRYLDEAKKHIEDSLVKFMHTELQTEDYGIIERITTLKDLKD